MEIKLEDDILGGSYYTYEKRGPYVRVSTTQEDHVDQGLLFWFKNTDAAKIKEVSESTADKGTKLHHYFDQIIKGSIPEVEEWAKKPVGNFIEGLKVIKPQSPRSEFKVVSKELGFAGTMDYLDEGSNKKVIMDWKTGHDSESHFVQLGMYALALLELGIRVDRFVVFYVHRDGEKSEMVEKSRKEVTKYVQMGLLTYQRWIMENETRLAWVLAPPDVWKARNHTRKAKRAVFDQENYKEEYQWPWLHRDVIKVGMQIWEEEE